MNPYRILTVALVTLLMVSAVGPAFVGTAAAHHEEEDNPLDDILAQEEQQPDDGLIGRLKGFVPRYLVDSMALVDGQLQRQFNGLSDLNPLAKETPTNERLAVEFDRAVEDRGDVFLTMFNEKTTPSESYDSHKITFAHEDSDSHVVYLVGRVDAENSTVESTEVLTESEFNETGRTVDAEWVVVGTGARELGELTHDLADRLEKDQPLDRSSQAQLVGRYCDLPESDKPPATGCDIRSSMWMNHSNLYDGVNTTEDADE